MGDGNWLLSDMFQWFVCASQTGSQTLELMETVAKYHPSFNDSSFYLIGYNSYVLPFFCPINLKLYERVTHRCVLATKPSTWQVARKHWTRFWMNGHNTLFSTGGSGGHRNQVFKRDRNGEKAGSSTLVISIQSSFSCFSSHLVWIIL